MATAFSQIKPSSIKMKVQVRYPGSIVGQDSVKVTTANGVVTVQSDYEALQVAGGFPSAEGGYVKGWDPVNGYYRISYDDIEAGAVSSAAAAAAAQAAAEAAETGAEAALAEAEAIASTGVLDVTAGVGVSIAGTSRHPIVNLGAAVKGDNLLSNTDWLLSTKLIGATASASVMKADGTALTAQIDVTSFTTSSGTPTMLTTNTRELYEGCYVVFGPGLVGLSGWALRVYDLVPNTSFKVSIPFNKATPSSSSAITAFMCGIVNSAANTYAPDHWVKSTSLAMWVDDFATNCCPGALRVVGIRKGSSSAEYFNFNTGGNFACQSVTERLRGKTVTFGAMVRCKVGGTGTRLIINDFPAGGGNVATYSSVVTGSSFTDASNNNYEFLTVTATISSASTKVDLDIEVKGSASDIVYFASPTLKVGSIMFRDDLGAPPREHILAETHWNPPCTVPLGIDNALGVGAVTPSTPLVPGSGLYGWQSIDVEAISFGQCHHTVSKVAAKIELTTSAPGCIIFLAALDVDNAQLTFGPQVSTQVANLTVCTNQTWLPLKKGSPSIGSPPGCFAIFSNNLSQGIQNITLDFDDVLGP